MQSQQVAWLICCLITYLPCFHFFQHPLIELVELVELLVESS
jgi:hypothetical protein